VKHNGLTIKRRTTAVRVAELQALRAAAEAANPSPKKLNPPGVWVWVWVCVGVYLRCVCGFVRVGVGIGVGVGNYVLGVGVGVGVESVISVLTHCAILIRLLECNVIHTEIYPCDFIALQRCCVGLLLPHTHIHPHDHTHTHAHAHTHTYTQTHTHAGTTIIQGPYEGSQVLRMWQSGKVDGMRLIAGTQVCCVCV
jgi:hypothetical protein